MSNNFPSVPGDLALASVTYAASFPAVSPASIGGGTVSIGGGLMNLGGLGSVQIAFPSPGSFGDFEQDEAEAGISQVITDVCQLVADIEQTTLTSVQARITVARYWEWVDPSGQSSATYQDTMTYPPTS